MPIPPQEGRRKKGQIREREIEMIICDDCGGLFEGDQSLWPDGTYHCNHCVKVRLLEEDVLKLSKENAWKKEDLLIEMTRMLDKRLKRL
jgi:hypothetical protein